MIFDRFAAPLSRRHWLRPPLRLGLHDREL